MKRKSILIAAVLMLAMLASCGESAENNDGEDNKAADMAENPSVETAEPEEVDIFADYRSINLDGRTVNISVSSNVSEGGAGMPSSYNYIAGPGEETGLRVEDNVFERNIFTEELLNCKLSYVADDLEFNEVQPYIEKLVMSGDAAVDYYVNDQYGLLYCALNGSLLDLADKSNFAENGYYFDFDSDAYYSDYMKGLALGSKRFIMTGDYFIDTMRAAHVLYFNKNLYDTQFGSSDELYESVINKQWTMDTFNSLVEKAYIDLDGDAQVSSADSYGLAIHSKSWTIPYYAFYYSTDAHVVEFDADGMPYIEQANVDRVSAMADYLISLHSSKGVCKTSGVGDSLKLFVNGQTLFTAFQKIGDMEQETIRDFDGMGVVPYPMMDESQETYKTFIHDTAELGAMPITTTGEAASAASAVIQVMSIHAHEYLFKDYYETALKVKYAQDLYTAQMLDLVVAGISAPFEFAYEFGYNSTASYLGGITFLPVDSSISKGTNVVSSEFATRRKTANKRLEKLIAVYTADSAEE